MTRACSRSINRALRIVSVATLILGVCRTAEGVFSLSIAPALVEMDLRAGESGSRELSFVNKGDTRLVVRAEVWDLEFGPNGERNAAPPGAKPDSVTPWFVFQPRVQVVPPGQLVTFTMTVTVPPGTTGAHYANVYLATVMDEGPGTMGLAARLPIRVLINAGGLKPRFTARVVEMHPPTPYDKMTLAVELKNVGGVHAWAEIGVDVLGPFSDFVASLAAKQPRVLVLPNETIKVPFSWEGELPPANYEVIATAYFGEGDVVIDQTRLEILASTSSPPPVPTSKTPQVDRKPQGATPAVVQKKAGTEKPTAKPPATKRKQKATRRGGP